MDYYSLLSQSRDMNDVSDKAEEYLKTINFSDEQMETIDKLKKFINENSLK